MNRAVVALAHFRSIARVESNLDSLARDPRRRSASPPVAMSQVDNRNSSAAKRARTDGSRREDDWTCPSCGNVNFSFRTTCNMRNCTQPRPADHNSKSAMKPVQPPQSYSSPSPYMGAGGPSSIYMGMPPYGSLFNGSSIPPYDVPFSGGSAYHYNYGGRLSAGSPYRPLHLSGAAPYSSGSMIGNGGMYGVPPMMDRYGLGLPMGPGGMVYVKFLSFFRCCCVCFSLYNYVIKCCSFMQVIVLIFFPRDQGRNFSLMINFKREGQMQHVITIGLARIVEMLTSLLEKFQNLIKTIVKQKMPEGSWKCEQCGNINYPFRTKCNKQNCGADKPSEAEKSPPPAEDENDQYDFFRAFIDKQLSTVPVSTRTYLRVEKVQSCRPALLQCGCLKVSLVVLMLQRLSSHSTLS
ncbi:uncharacterized protein J3R85_009676 [Psidium guajava]|nr:uncharacterized protein J3R85_009676 [Psidium guajava]